MRQAAGRGSYSRRQWPHNRLLGEVLPLQRDTKPEQTDQEQQGAGSGPATCTPRHLRYESQESGYGAPCRQGVD